jgi:PTH1 family peptidyl-tRNA hydrolase
MEALRLIVGLGNPGADYAGTRHNAGFILADRLAVRWRSEWKAERKFQAVLAKAASIGAGGVLLCKPQTYMNCSGETVGAVTDFFRVPADRCLVVVDDADLELGHLRLRAGGSSGGHHGLESVEQHLGTREYPRLRIGIGRRTAEREITGHVLGRFTKAEAGLLEQVLARAAEQAECWVLQGIQKAMNEFNGAVVSPDNEGKTK